MTAISFTLILIGVLLNAAAQLLLKAGTNSVGTFVFSRDNIVPVGWQLATEPHIIAGMSCYVISVVVWVLALSRVEVSIAYPMLSIGYLLNALAAWYFFDEMMSPQRLAGIGIILIGVYVLART